METWARQLLKLVLLVACWGNAPAYAQSATYWAPHWQSRLFTVQAQAPHALAGMAILGDSNSETFRWTAIPSCQVLNAGFGGARIRQLAELAESIAPNIPPPRVVHYMGGTNNILTDRAADPVLQAEWATMATDIHRAVVAFRAIGSRVVLWPVPPMAQASAPANYQADRTHINALLEAEFNANGGLAGQAVYWDWWWPGQISNASGYALAGTMMGDGVHFTNTTQVSRYQRLDVWRQHIQSQGHAAC